MRGPCQGAQHIRQRSASRARVAHHIGELIAGVAHAKALAQDVLDPLACPLVEVLALHVLQHSQPRPRPPRRVGVRAEEHAGAAHAARRGALDVEHLGAILRLQPAGGGRVDALAGLSAAPSQALLKRARSRRPRGAAARVTHGPRCRPSGLKNPSTSTTRLPFRSNPSALLWATLTTAKRPISRTRARAPARAPHPCRAPPLAWGVRRAPPAAPAPRGADGGGRARRGGAGAAARARARPRGRLPRGPRPARAGGWWWVQFSPALARDPPAGRGPGGE